jgi:predicted nucleic acid-binding protein
MSPLISPFRAVLDTNVVFEGLTKQGGACGLIIDGWNAGVIMSCVSNALAYEYTDVLSRKLSENRWRTLKPILGTLLSQSEFIPIYYSWRPMSNDPGDEHVIDCAMNAYAPVVTSNLRDFRIAQQELGLQVMTPVDLVTLLAR